MPATVVGWDAGAVAEPRLLSIEGGPASRRLHDGGQETGPLSVWELWSLTHDRSDLARRSPGDEPLLDSALTIRLFNSPWFIFPYVEQPPFGRRFFRLSLTCLSKVVIPTLREESKCS